MLTPSWKPAAANHFALAPRERDWLLGTGSLTRRLTALNDGRFRVRILDEGWRPLREDERLASPVIGEDGWVREVLLCGDDCPWVYARTVITRHSLEAVSFPIQRLGSQPLGSLLFGAVSVPRGAFELCRYPQALLPEEVAVAAPWARRSPFTSGCLQLLVAEVFLPALWEAETEHG